MAGVDLRHQGVVLLNTRINFYDGRRPTDDQFQGGDPEYDYWRGRHADWSVVRRAPKEPTWATSTHPIARKAHRVKYQLTGAHVSGLQVQITVWMCGARCMSPVKVVTNTRHRQCWTCLGRK